MATGEEFPKYAERISGARVSRASRGLILGTMLTSLATVALILLFRMATWAWPDPDSMVGSVPDAVRDIGSANEIIGQELRWAIPTALGLVIALHAVVIGRSRSNPYNDGMSNAIVRMIAFLTASPCVVGSMLLIVGSLSDFSLVATAIFPTIFVLILLLLVYAIGAVTIASAQVELQYARVFLADCRAKLSKLPAIRQSAATGFVATLVASVAVAFIVLIGSPDPLRQVGLTLAYALFVSLPGSFLLAGVLEDIRISAWVQGRRTVGKAAVLIIALALAVVAVVAPASTFLRLSAAWGLTTVVATFSAVVSPFRRLAGFTVRGAYAQIRRTGLLRTVENQRERIAELEELVLHDPGLPAASD